MAKWAIGLVMAVWLVFGAAWAFMHGWIVPRIAELRPELENRASQQLGVQVRIGAIAAETTGLVPQFTLTDVRLLDATGAPTLALSRVEAAVSVASLLRLGVTRLTLTGAELDVRLSRDGRLFVAGIELASTGTGHSPAADWVFAQDRIEIVGGALRYTDERSGQPPLILTAVDAQLRNDGRRHALSLRGTPPERWGSPFELRAVVRSPLLSRTPGDWREWEGELYANAPRIDLQPLQSLIRLPLQAESGQGALRVWADLSSGQIQSTTVDMALQNLSLTLRPGLSPLAMRSASGRLSLRRLAGGAQASTEGLRFVTADGLVWPGGNLSGSYVEGEGALMPQGELLADTLDLQALTQLATRLPLPAQLQERAAVLAPQGRVERLSVRWRGRWPSVDTFEVRGRLTGLSLEAHENWPGVSGLALDVDATQAGGTARAVVTTGSVTLPGVFDEPRIPLDRLAADLRWQQQGRRLSVQVDRFEFANADAAGSLTGSWRTADAPAGVAPAHSRHPGVVDLRGQLSRANGARVPRYLPRIVKADVRRYLERAIVSGDAQDVSFRLRGDLLDFPFAAGRDGEFTVTAPIREAEFAYAPEPKAGRLWPVLTEARGTLLFDRDRIEVRDASGRLGRTGLLISEGSVRIPTVLSNTTVEVSARARGPLGEALQVVRTSPLSGLLQGALDEASGSGPADLRLQLVVPVFDAEQTRVQGSLLLAGNDVQINPSVPQVTRARGTVSFTQSGFSLAAVQGRVLGGDARLEGGGRVTPAGDLDLQLRLQGVVTADGLRAARELGVVSRLGQRLSGSTAYAATIGLRRGRPEITLTSSLQGMGVDLPAPLGKPAASALPLRFDNTLLVREGDASGRGRDRDRLLLELGRVFSVEYEREWQGDEPRVLRGTMAIGLADGEGVAMPAAGVAANVSVDRVDLDAWGDALDGLLGASAPAAARSTPLPGPAAQVGARAAAAATASLTYLPTVMALRATELTVAQRTLRRVVVGGGREGLLWRANIEADELSGYGEYRQPSAAGPGLLYARLARLDLAQAQAGDVERLLEEQPAALPAVDVVVERFTLAGRDLGRLEVEAVNRNLPPAAPRAPPGREWRLSKLNVAVPEATLTATGNWVALGSAPAAVAARGVERRRTVLNFKLDIADSGALLQRFGQGGVIRRGKGRLEGQIGWIGSPIKLDTPTLTGRFNVQVEEGQFLKADPGIGRLLGVLSLQSLPRRLTLDFRDVFSEGFAFDFIRGDVVIDQGVASTNNLQMKGVNAAVLMDGKADITRETQDLRVVVVPEINAGTASVVASVINPAVGLGSFLAQLFLRRPLIEANTQEFRIDGSWVDPRVTRVERSARTGAAATPATPAADAGDPTPGAPGAQAPASAVTPSR